MKGAYPMDKAKPENLSAEVARFEKTVASILSVPKRDIDASIAAEKREKQTERQTPNPPKTDK